MHSKVLVITDGWTWVTEGNYTYVRGSVKNIGNRVINHFEVNVKYEDTNKNYQCINISVNNYKDFL
ncbi:hypothetical protein KPL37_11700 [Clostridium frigoris]|uniref:Uncharacterized protein n=1 Tax=Clostridium frigoris TaxID=205327 RepID=A0ABS6BV83_9CLOT|nr:hypothetical protein [Clostridium frigoris]MBU3160410.1 hypothetical protein [Clostridium frigoris]